MDPEFVQVIEWAIVLSVCSVIQSTVGFAYGLFAIPPLVWLGMPLAHAIAMVISASLVQSAWASFRLRSDIKLSVALPVVIVRNLSMPIGVLVLLQISELDQAMTAQLIGVVLLTVVAMLWFLKAKPGKSVHMGWGLGAFVCSGVMAGMFGMGAPPLVLWVMCHNWSSRQTRAFLLFNMMAMAPLQLLVLWLMIGSQVGEPILWGLAFSPVVLVGAQIGLWLGRAISKSWLQTIAYGLLVLIACGSILAPLLKTDQLPYVEESVTVSEVRAHVE